MVMAPGTALEQTAAEALGAEQELMKLPFVKGVHSEIRDNQATLTVSLKSYGEGGTRDAVSSDRLKEMLKNRKEAQFHVLPVGRHGEETKISLYLEGPDADRLRSIQDQVRETLSRFLGIKDVIVRHRNPIPIVELKLDRALLETSGVNVRELAYHVRQNFTGPVSARIMTGERLTSIRVRALRDPHHGMEPLRQTTVRSELNRMVPFTELTSPSVRLAEGELRRQDRRPVVAMTLLLHKESDPLSIAREIRTAMDSIAMPSEYGFSFGDEIHDISRTRKEMFVALGMGLTLIYLILIVSTESLLQPLVIMTALPFGACGAVIALSLLHVPVSLPVYVGLMILCGLIVNVNVVMTYTINTMRSSGRTLDEAVSAGAQRRFRAILMTVLATIFATTPMLLDRGEGSSMWSPFALTLAVGIATSTLFSLVITPILYKTMERLKQSMRRFTAS